MGSCFSKSAIKIAVFIALLGQLVPAAIAQSVATEPVIPVSTECRFSKPSAMISSLKEMPEIASEFERLKLAIAGVGEPYRPFDLIDNSNRNLPNRKFVRAYKFDDLTIVWYIRGGFTTNWQIVEFKHQRGHQSDPLVLRATGKALSGWPCEATQALLNGVASAQGW